AELAAEALRLTAEDLLNFGLIDGIIPEPPGGAQDDPDAAAELMRKKLRDALAELGRLSQRELVEQRYKKFRRMGKFFGVPAGRRRRQRKRRRCAPRRKMRAPRSPPASPTPLPVKTRRLKA